MPNAAPARQPRVTLSFDGPAGPPDLFVQAADGGWYPAYSVRDRLVDGVFVTTFYVHHPEGAAALTAERVNELAAVGRVLAPTALLAVVDDEPAPPARPVRAADRPAAPSPRLVDLDEDGPSRWEKMRKLLNARCGQYAGHVDGDRDLADRVRHGAARFVSEGRTESSMDLDTAEMEDAVTYVEHLLHDAGFDLEAADAEYRQRRAARLRSAA